MDLQGRWWHGVVIASPALALLVALPMRGGWGLCVPALSMPFMATLALVMAGAHLRARSWGWGLGMLAVAVLLFLFGYTAHALSTINGPTCIPRGWESWPWLY